MSFFDSGTVDIQPDFEVLPSGIYKVMVESCECKKTKDGLGFYVGTSFEVIEGKHQGRKCFTNFNIINNNEKAMEIGRSDFAKFLIACDSPVLNTHEDCVQLQNKILFVAVTLKTNKASGNVENKVGKFKKNVQQQQQPMQQQPMQQQPMQQQPDNRAMNMDRPQTDLPF